MMRRLAVVASPRSIRGVDRGEGPMTRAAAATVGMPLRGAADMIQEVAR